MLLNERKNITLGSVMLITTALIWGLAFVAQRTAAGSIDAISFNGLRFIIGASCLVPVIFFIDFISKRKGKNIIGWNKATFLGGVLCGITLFIGNNLQQMGLEQTTAGKAGFITALYIVIVPIIGLLMGRKTHYLGWFAVIIAVLGFWIMCVNDTFSIGQGDIVLLLCSFVFAFHIIFVDIFSKKCDAIKLTFFQFFVAAIISIPAMAINGFPTVQAIENSIIPLLYVGILSSAVAFTFQTAGQKRTPPALATLIMSLESVFALFGGIIILNESSSPKELIGCLMVFIAVFLAEQEPVKVFLDIKEKN